jgi:hypothetical protein
VSEHITAFLDTNTFLHYLSLDQIDWPVILDAQSVFLMVAPTVLRELEKQKALNAVKRLRKRAAGAIAALDAYVDTGSPAKVRDKVSVDFVIGEPSIEFEALHLSRFIEDDNLLATVIEYSKGHPRNKVVLVTADLGLKLKALHLHIAVRRLPDRLQLPDELDQNEIKVKELQERLRALENSLPELGLIFEDGEDHASFQVGRCSLHADAMEARMAEARKKSPLWDEQNYALRIKSFSATPFFDIPTLQDVRSYNSRLESYYQTYGEYLDKLRAFEEQKSRALLLKLWVRNSGGVPAEDIDIEMHFPDGFTLLSNKDLPKPPPEPTPPAPPRTAFEKLGLSMASELELSSALALFRSPLSAGLGAPHLSGIGPPPNVSRMRIKRSSSYDVECHIRSIKHKCQVPLEPMNLIFDSLEAATSFRVECHMLASNYPSAIRCDLHVIVEK